MIQENKSIGKLQSIQVLRAMAALLVVVFHASGDILRHGWLVTGASWIGSHGEIGVDIFFVVSGFVMASTTQNSPQTMTSACRFMASRLKRIVPLYWFATTVFVAMLLLVPHMFGAATFDLAHVISSYAFIPWRNPAGQPAPVLNVGWTLNYEMWFYLVYAVVICVTRHRVSAIATLFLATSALSLLGWSSVAFQTYTSPIVLEFVLGAIIGSLYARGFRLSLVCAIGLLAIAFGMSATLGETTDNVYRFAVFGIPAALLVAAGVGLEMRIHWPRAMQSIGDASYSLYLSHVFTVPVAVKLLERLDAHHRLSGTVICAISVLLSVCVALLCYQRIEKPLTRALKNSARGSRVNEIVPVRNA